MKQEAPAAHRGGPRTATSATLISAQYHHFWQTIGNSGAQSQVLSDAEASYARPVAMANQRKRWDRKTRG